ncbi:MAG: FAD-dependent oxidoreductase [Spirochaetaceae bacterium]|nr:FAD-dependent oxidoreductase [Spirochaetaceae bacterium]
MKKDVDLLIIGGGPAGMTAAQYGARAALKTLLIEQSAFGGQALMINCLENYPGNSAGRSGSEISLDLHKQAEAFGAELFSGTVIFLRKKEKLFEAGLEDGGLIRAKAVIFATGAGHRTLDIPGETQFSGVGVSYCASCDGPFFKNKKIFMVGGGDAVCDEAEFLSKITPDITILVRRSEFRAQKAIAQRILNNKSIRVWFNTRITAIKGVEKVESIILENTKTGEKREEPTAAVFIFAGILPKTELLTELAVTLDNAGFIKTNQNMETSVPGLFAVGDVRSSPFRQVVVAASDGAIAAHTAAAHIAEIPETNV